MNVFIIAIDTFCLETLLACREHAAANLQLATFMIINGDSILSI